MSPRTATELRSQARRVDRLVSVINTALRAMKNGGESLHKFNDNEQGKVIWSLSKSGEIPAAAANHLIHRLEICSVGDGLFPADRRLCQTWRWAEPDNHEENRHER